MLVVGLSSSASIVAQRSSRTVLDKPNVVLIIMDDLGYGDIGSYGVRDARTPNLDRLAREGVRLTNSYSNGANCTPTRAALISGRYQQRVGLEWPLGDGEKDRGLPVTGRSLPALLKTNGYATGLVGKWHLGFKPEFGPNAHGFDEFFGFLSGAVDYYSHRRGDGTPDLFENTTPVETTEYLTDEITRRSISFVDKHAGGPFFLEVAYNAVHWPFEPPNQRLTDPNAVPQSNATGDFRLYQGPDDEKPATRQDYVRMLERADEGVGAILASLDRHALSKKHVGHIHQRQRRRVAFAQRAIHSPKEHTLGRWHPRAVNLALAGSATGGKDIGTDGHNDGPDCFDRRGDANGGAVGPALRGHQHYSEPHWRVVACRTRVLLEDRTSQSSCKRQ